jgi:hypothetical protein
MRVQVGKAEVSDGSIAFAPFLEFDVVAGSLVIDGQWDAFELTEAFLCL